MEAVTRIYEATLSDPVALLFARIITGWFVAALIVAWIPALSSTRAGSRIVPITPNILATLGVLGTFTGILIGLLDFNVEKIEESVPALLVGLKIAFSTSIVGMSAAIVFRSLQTFAPTRTTSSGVTPEDIHSVLTELRDGGGARLRNRLTTLPSSEMPSRLRVTAACLPRCRNSAPRSRTGNPS